MHSRIGRHQRAGPDRRLLRLPRRYTAATTCVTGPGTAIVLRRVAYNDLNPLGDRQLLQPATNGTPATSCGLAMNIMSWDVIGADS